MIIILYGISMIDMMCPDGHRYLDPRFPMSSADMDEMW